MSFEPASGGPQTVHERKTCLVFKRKKLGGFKGPKQRNYSKVIVTQSIFRWWQMEREGRLGFTDWNKRKG